MVDSGTVKLSANKTKWTSLEVRTQHTFLETLISKYDFGLVKLLGLLRNGPLFFAILGVIWFRSVFQDYLDHCT